MGEPLVTIAIPSYQCAGYIGEAIDSALSQDFQDLEVLVIDDASTDGTDSVLARFSDPRLRVMHNEVNLGPGRTWNRLLEEARGRYVRVMGSDDVLRPGSVSAQVAVMERDPRVVIATGPREIITANGSVLMRRGNGGLSGKVTGAAAGALMVRRGENVVGEPCAALVRVSAVRAVGGFDEGAPYTIDMDLWLRLLQVGDLFVLDRPTCGYRILPTSWSARVAASQDADVLDLIRRAAANGWFGTRPADAEAGARRARRLAIGRRVLYGALFDIGPRRRLLLLAVGGWIALVGYLAFAVLYVLVGTAIGYVPVLVGSYALALLSAYGGYRLVVLRAAARPGDAVTRFAIVYLVALGVNMVVFPWLTRALGSDPYVGQAIVTVALAIGAHVVNERFSLGRGA